MDKESRDNKHRQEAEATVGPVLADLERDPAEEESAGHARHLAK